MEIKLVSKIKTILMSCVICSGCATTSGLQTYDIPDQGNYRTEQGAQLNVVQLNQNNIPSSLKSSLYDSGQLSSLFKNYQDTYRLSSGDILSVQLWAYPEITPPVTDSGNAKALGYTIDSNGNIYLPLVGQIKVSGKTLSQVNQLLKSQFSKFLKHPDAVVRVLSYEGRRYFVNGQVLKSGQYTLNDQPVSLYTALSMAGGVNPQTGDNSNIQLIRGGTTYDLNPLDLERLGYSLHNLLIHADDTIFVNAKQNQKIYVMGESNKNQGLEMRDQGMTLSDALGESQGINPLSASAARIYIMRTDVVTKTSTIYHLDLSSLGNLALANQFNMRKNDIVYIDATGLTRWQRVLNQVIPFSSLLYNFDRVGQ